MLKAAAIFVLAASLIGGNSDDASEDPLGQLSQRVATSDGTEVDVYAETLDPSSRDAIPDEAGVPTRSPSPAATPTNTCAPGDLCREGYSVAMLPEVHASDLVSFRPDTAATRTEPNGLGIAGLPVNLLASASTHEMSGPLLGYDVTVRFTPVGYVFAPGDGTTNGTTHGGSSWESLGVEDFTPTPTSHVYGEPGTYVPSVRVEYAAEVDFGTGRWRPVVGTVMSAPSASEVLVLEMHTALVQHSCLEDPTGIGC